MEILRGILSFLAVVLNTLFWCIFLLSVAVLKLLVPVEAWKKVCTKIIINVGECWIYCNGLWIKLLHRPELKVEGFESLDRSKWYLSVANHQSWADIFVLQDITNRQIPMLKFFMKHVLIWVPVIGLAWWALDMPFLKRYTKEQLEKNPKLGGKDVIEMKRALKHYALYPVTVFSFAEGTRFTLKKHHNQNSPFKNLLKPKEGGLATALSLVSKIDSLIDFTIKFDSKKRSFWDYLCGRMSSAKIIIKEIKIPKKFLNENLLDNQSLRSEFKEWINLLWIEKDKLLSNRE